MSVSRSESPGLARGTLVFGVVLATAPIALLGNVSTVAADPTCTAGGPPRNVTPPTVSPIPAVVGTSLWTNNGIWDQGQQCAPEYYTYQWNRNGTPISGATSQSYVTQAADADPTGTTLLTATVTAWNHDEQHQLQHTDALSSNHVNVTIPASPTAGAMVDLAGPRLTASPNDNPLEYQFQVSDTNFGNVLADSGWGTENSYDVPVALADGTTYYWRARVRNPDDSDTSAWTSVSSFIVMLPKLGTRDYWPMWSHGPLSVNEANGNLILSAPTPTYPTASGSLGFSLTYNSQDNENHGFGSGWLLVAGDDLAAPPLELIDHWVNQNDPDHYDGAEVVLPDGSSDIYVHFSGANYRSPLGATTQLTKNADGRFTFVDEDGTIYGFDAADPNSGVAKLLRAESAETASDRGQMIYDWGNDPTKPTSVTFKQSEGSTFTRTLQLNWSCAGALLCVTGPDLVTTWRYVGTAGDSGPLWRVNDGTRDLVAFSYTNGLLSTVKNANDLDPPSGYNGNHALSISYAAGTPARVASVSEGPVTGQAPATSTWTFAYAYGSFTTAPTSYAHADIGANQTRQAFGYTTVTPPRQQGLPNPKSVKTYFDRLAHPMQVTDIDGTITKVSYTDKDQHLWSEDEDGNPTDYTYDPVNDVRLSATGPDPDGPGGPLARPVTGYRYDEQQIGTSGAPGTPLKGVQGHYFTNASLSGKAALRRTDPNIDFGLGSGWYPTTPAVQSVRWIANVDVPTTGDYTFVTASDAQAGTGTRLSVDAAQATDHWSSGGTFWSAPIHLTVGMHKFVYEYKHTAAASSAWVSLGWTCSTCNPPIDEIIGNGSLRPAWLNQTSVVSPSGKLSFNHFAQPEKALTDYDLVQLAGGTNVITSYEYDSLGRMTRKVMPKGNAGRAIDASGNLTGTPDLNYATDYAYWGDGDPSSPPTACGGGNPVDQSGLLKSSTPHGIATRTATYDLAGRTIAVVKGAGTTCTYYDAEGRVTSDKAPGEAQATTYTYDPNSARLTAADASGTVTSAYDEAGRLKSSVDSFGASAALTYDSESNLIQRKATPLTTTYTTNYVYDDANRLTSEIDPAGRSYSFYYDTRGALKATQYPNSTFSWSDHNPDGSLAALYNRHGILAAQLPGSVPPDLNPIVDYAYTYDIDGKQTQELRTGGGLTPRTTSYLYDNLGRLSQVTLPSGTCRKYFFDVDSNRTQIQESATGCGGSFSTTASYSYDQAHLDELSSRTQGGQTTMYGYTSDGQVSTRGSETLSWEGRGRLSGSSLNSGITYSFDAAGFRRQRTSAPGLPAPRIHRYLLGGLFQKDGANALIESEIEGPAGDLAHYAGAPTITTGVSFLYYAGHGDLAAEASTLGSRTADYTYDPFGAPNDAVPDNTTTERWTGRWDKKLDTTTNLIEMGARPYDPTLGRFLATDPVDGGSLNSYDYANQEPINTYDLDGNEPAGNCSRFAPNRVAGCLWRRIKDGIPEDCNNKCVLKNAAYFAAGSGAAAILSRIGARAAVAMGTKGWLRRGVVGINEINNAMGQASVSRPKLAATARGVAFLVRALSGKRPPSLWEVRIKLHF